MGRAQSGIEYVMTYGIVITIILVLGVAIFAFDFATIKKRDKASVVSMMRINDQKMTQTEIMLNFYNPSKDPILIRSILADPEKGGCYYGGESLINPGSSSSVLLICPSSTGEVGQVADIDFEIFYSLVGSDNPVIHKSKGNIRSYIFGGHITGSYGGDLGSACVNNAGCGECMVCIEGVCDNAPFGVDPKNECDPDECAPGSCNGLGECEIYTNGKHGCPTGQECNPYGVCSSSCKDSGPCNYGTECCSGLCISGSCSDLCSSSGGMVCSDDSDNPFSADGTCTTYPSDCDEDEIAYNDPYYYEDCSSSISAYDSTPWVCDTSASGGFEAEGICVFDQTSCNTGIVAYDGTNTRLGCENAYTSGPAYKSCDSFPGAIYSLDGVCVLGGACDTMEVAYCGNSYKNDCSACGSTLVYACDSNVERDFIQDGICVSGGVCKTSAACYSQTTSTYYGPYPSCNDRDSCDTSSLSDGYNPDGRICLANSAICVPDDSVVFDGVCCQDENCAGSLVCRDGLCKGSCTDIGAPCNTGDSCCSGLCIEGVCREDSYSASGQERCSDDSNDYSSTLGGLWVNQRFCEKNMVASYSGSYYGCSSFGCISTGGWRCDSDVSPGYVTDGLSVTPGNICDKNEVCRSSGYYHGSLTSCSDNEPCDDDVKDGIFESDRGSVCDQQCVIHGSRTYGQNCCQQSNCASELSCIEGVCKESCIPDGTSGCLTGGDCCQGLCVMGTCRSSCSSYGGQACSDDALNDYSADGSCTTSPAECDEDEIASSSGTYFLDCSSSSTTYGSSPWSCDNLASGGYQAEGICVYDSTSCSKGIIAFDGSYTRDGCQKAYSTGPLYRSCDSIPGSIYSLDGVCVFGGACDTMEVAYCLGAYNDDCSICGASSVFSCDSNVDREFIQDGICVSGGVCKTSLACYSQSKSTYYGSYSSCTNGDSCDTSSLSDGYNPEGRICMANPATCVPDDSVLLDGVCCQDENCAGSLICKDGICKGACSLTGSSCDIGDTCCSGLCIEGVCRDTTYISSGASRCSDDSNSYLSAFGGVWVSQKFCEKGMVATYLGSYYGCSSSGCSSVGGWTCDSDVSPGFSTDGLSVYPGNLCDKDDVCFSSGYYYATMSSCPDKSTCDDSVATGVFDSSRGSVCKSECVLKDSRTEGGICCQDENCAAGLSCVDGYCAVPCKDIGLPCTQGTDCCSNYCVGGFCREGCSSFNGYKCSIDSSNYASAGLCTTSSCKYSGTLYYDGIRYYDVWNSYSGQDYDISPKGVSCDDSVSAGVFEHKGMLVSMGGTWDMGHCLQGGVSVKVDSTSGNIFVPGCDSSADLCDTSIDLTVQPFSEDARCIGGLCTKTGSVCFTGSDYLSNLLLCNTGDGCDDLREGTNLYERDGYVCSGDCIPDYSKLSGESCCQTQNCALGLSCEAGVCKSTCKGTNGMCSTGSSCCSGKCIEGYCKSASYSPGISCPRCSDDNNDYKSTASGVWTASLRCEKGSVSKPSGTYCMDLSGVFQSGGEPCDRDVSPNYVTDSITVYGPSCSSGPVCRVDTSRAPAFSSPAFYSDFSYCLNKESCDKLTSNGVFIKDGIVCGSQCVGSSTSDCCSDSDCLEGFFCDTIALGGTYKCRTECSLTGSSCTQGIRCCSGFCVNGVCEDSCSPFSMSQNRCSDGVYTFDTGGICTSTICEIGTGYHYPPLGYYANWNDYPCYDSDIGSCSCDSLVQNGVYSPDGMWVYSGGNYDSFHCYVGSGTVRIDASNANYYYVGCDNSMDLCDTSISPMSTPIFAAEGRCAGGICQKSGSVCYTGTDYYSSYSSCIEGNGCDSARTGTSQYLRDGYICLGDCVADQSRLQGQPCCQSSNCVSGYTCQSGTCQLACTATNGMCQYGSTCCSGFCIEGVCRSQTYSPGTLCPRCSDDTVSFSSSPSGVWTASYTCEKVSVARPESTYCLPMAGSSPAGGVPCDRDVSPSYTTDGMSVYGFTCTQGPVCRVDVSRPPANVAPAYYSDLLQCQDNEQCDSIVSNGVFQRDGFMCYGSCVTDRSRSNGMQCCSNYNCQSGYCNGGVCSPILGEIGRVSEWCGKVNVYKSFGGAWASDPDCSSGCNQNKITYCRKFWPSTVSVLDVAPVESKTFMAGACSGSYPSYGQVEYVCLA